jgi:uncharacterized protein (DUF362 family)
MDSVAVVKAIHEIESPLSEGLRLIEGFGRLQSPVIIKPNICTISDNTGFSVTDVKMIEAVINFLLEDESTLSIKIVESDSQSKWANEAFDKFGYTKLAKKFQNQKYDVTCVNLSERSTEPIDFKGKYFTNPELPDILINPGYVISVAVAKTHYLTFITGVLKNLFGFLPRKDQSFYHSDINEVIIDLARLVPSNLNIIDARVGIEGWNGPKTRRLNTFILGHKPVSVDATMVRVMGFDPGKIQHVVDASKYNLGTLNPRILGQPIESVKERFNPPRELD